MRNRKAHTLLALLALLSLILAGFWPASAQDVEHPRAAEPPVPLAAPFSPESAPAFKAGEVLVKFKAGESVDGVQGLLARYSATHIETLAGVDVEVWQVPEGREFDIVEQLSAEPGVEYAEPNYRYQALGTPNDPNFGKQWAHTKMHSTAAWDITTGSAGVKIAVLDSGIDTGHPDLAGKIIAGYDYVDGDSNPGDENGHGTHVAGIAAAVTNNGTGVAGMDWNARIMPIRVLDDSGSGYTTWLVNGINYAYTNGADVINLSLGGPGYSQPLQDAINAAHGAGTLVVAAMGNDDTSTPFYPAANANVLAVSATGPTDAKASYSNYGAHCDVAAPGGDMTAYHDPDGIYSTMPTYPVYLTTYFSYYQNYDYLHGTSQATPYVSGLAALIWALQPGYSPDQVQTVIENTAVDLGAAGWDQIFGHGRIDAQAALQSIAAPTTPLLAPISNPDGDGSYIVDWNDVPNATSYTLQEDDNASFSSPSTAYSGANSQYSVSGQGPGAWYYRVRANGPAGTSGWSNTQSVVVRPNAPTLNAISNPGNGDAYTVSWSASASATSYTLQEANNASFTGAQTRYAGTALQYDVTGQMAGTWYYRVRAHNSGGDSTWSNSQSTTVDPRPLGQPTLAAISNPDGDGNYLVNWSDVSGATGYILEESDNPYFVDPNQVYSGAASQFSVAAHASGHWYYRARATGPSGNGPWSDEQDVIVTTYVYLPFVARQYTPAGGNFGLPINEGFENNLVPPTGWTLFQTNPRQTWKIMQIGTPYAGSYSADCEYDDWLANQNEVLLSPEFQANSAQLQFYSFGSPYWCRDTYDNCDLKIWLVIGAWGGGDDIHVYTADGDWPSGTPFVWTQSTVNLTPHLPSGTPVRVGFQYEGQDGAQIALDAIRITEN